MQVHLLRPERPTQRIGDPASDGATATAPGQRQPVGPGRGSVAARQRRNGRRYRQWRPAVEVGRAPTPTVPALKSSVERVAPEEKQDVEAEDRAACPYHCREDPAAPADSGGRSCERRSKGLVHRAKLTVNPAQKQAKAATAPSSCDGYRGRGPRIPRREAGRGGGRLPDRLRPRRRGSGGSGPCRASRPTSCPTGGSRRG